jgi:hypothetical protein
MLTPTWNTDVVADYLAANCAKVVANDAADAIIADTASLKSGIALWKEVRRGVTTARVGWRVAAPVAYRMADWEDVSVSGEHYDTSLPCREGLSHLLSFARIKICETDSKTIECANLAF